MPPLPSPTRSLVAGVGDVNFVAPSPHDASVFALGTEGGSVFLYKRGAAAAALTATLGPASAAISSLCWDTRDTTLLYAAAGCRLVVFATHSGELLADLALASDDISALASHPSLPLLVAADDDGNVYVVGVPAPWKLLRCIPAAHASICGTLALRSRGGSSNSGGGGGGLDLVTGGFDRTLRVWDVGTGRLRLSVVADGVGEADLLRLEGDSSSARATPDRAAAAATLTAGGAGSAGTPMLNPPFVHAVCWHPSAAGLLAVGLGNGAVALLQIKEGDGNTGPRPSSRGGGGGGTRGGRRKRGGGGAGSSTSADEYAALRTASGGGGFVTLLFVGDAHAAAATCVGFVQLRGNCGTRLNAEAAPVPAAASPALSWFLYSAGNDGHVRLWAVDDLVASALESASGPPQLSIDDLADWVDGGGGTTRACPVVAATSAIRDAPRSRLVCDIAHGRGPNWVCVVRCEPEGGADHAAHGVVSLAVCDTTQRLTLYSFGLAAEGKPGMNSCSR